MKLFNLASNQSFWRGIDYFHAKKVKTWKQIDNNHLEDEVEGS